MAGDDGESAGNVFAFSPVVKPLGSHRLEKKSIVSEDQKTRGGTMEKCVLCQVATWCQETKDRISRRQPLLMSGPGLYCEQT